MIRSEGAHRTPSINERLTRRKVVVVPSKQNDRERACQTPIAEIRNLHLDQLRDHCVARARQARQA